ncbi:MAG: AlbA family DNA-binding domain-containing protein [Actinomycetota bacterium]
MSLSNEPRNKPIEDWTDSDLQVLVDTGRAEQRDVEYKQSMPSRTDRDRRETGADMSSFGNSSGGLLIYGIEAKDGIPQHVVGLDEPADPFVLWLDQIAQTIVEPRLPGLRMQSISTADGKHCVVVRVPMSWNKPHAVKVNDALRFYSRNSAGKYLLDLREVRELFTGSELARERLTRFRADRVMSIESGDTPVPLVERPKVVLHLVPLQAFTGGLSVEVREFQWRSRVGQLQTIAGGFDGWRYNLDGLVTYLGEGEGRVTSYVQVFRNGVIEAADSYSVVGRLGPDDVIPSKTFEQKVLDAVPPLMEALRFMKVEPPVMLMLSLVGVKGIRMGLARGTSDPIDRDVLLIPEALVEAYPDDPAPLMHPLIDVVWNACGLERSPNFDIEGNYFR